MIHKECRWLVVRALATWLAMLVAGVAQAGWLALGPFGGEANIVRVSASSRDLVVAAARNGMIFRTTDGGAHWTPKRFPLQLSCVLHAFEIDPEYSGTWYAGIETGYRSISGLYRTKDGGDSWAPVAGLTGQSVWALAIWQGDARVIAAGTADGVYISHDRGETWARISPDWNRDLRPVVSLAFHPARQEILYAGTTHLPWRTMDAGATWQSIDAGMIDDSDVFSLRVNANKPSVMFASACSGVYRSESAGSQWTRLPTPQGAFRAYQVTLDPMQPETVYAGTGLGLLKSPDGGNTWRKLTDHIVESIAFDPVQRGRIYFASATAGLLASQDNGETLRESNRGFTNRNFTSFDGVNGTLYASSIYERTGGLFRSDDQGGSWERITPASLSPDENILATAVAPGDPKTVYLATPRGIQKSADRGQTWKALHPPAGAERISDFTVVRGSVNSVLLAGTPAGLFRSENDGATWTRTVYLRYGKRGALPSMLGPRVQLLQRSGEAGVGVVTAAGAFLSRNSGMTWYACPAPADSTHWYGIALLEAASPGVVLAATSHGLFRSADRCRSWQAVQSGLSGTDSVTLVYPHPLRPEELYAAQNGQIFRSGDGGAHWRMMEEAEGDGSYVSKLLILPSDPGRLFALASRRGILVHNNGPNTDKVHALGVNAVGGKAIPAEIPETIAPGDGQPEGAHN